MALRYRAVLFDLDGTLVDSYAALADAVNFARRSHGHDDLPEGRIREFVGDGLQTLLQRAFDTAEVPKGAVDAFEQRYDEICCGQSRLLDDVYDTITRLDALGIAMAVCTNKPTVFSTKILEHLELARFFRSIVGPDAAGARKPEARHVIHALEATGCREEEALFVGDMPIDVRAARNAGIAVAVVTTGSSTLDELRDAGPDHILERFSHLMGVVST